MRRSLFFIAAIMLLSNCGVNRNVSLFTNDECEILAKKRVVGKTSRQPKIKPGSYATSNTSKRKPVIETIDTHALHVESFPFKIESASLYASTSPAIHYRNPEPSNSQTVTAYLEESNNLISPAAETLEDGSCAQEEHTTSRTITHEASALIAGSLIASLSLIMFATPYFMRVSAWAAHHPVATKVALAGIHTVTTSAAILAGNSLSTMGFSLPLSTFIAGALGAGTAAYLYPSKGKSLLNFTQKYRLHKFCDALLFTSGIALVGFAGNKLEEAHPISRLTSTYIVPEISMQKAPVKIYEYKIEKVKQEKPVKKNTGLKILVVFLFVLLTIVVAAVSCSLICSGQGVLAAVFGIGAEVGLVLLMNHFLRKLNGSKPKKDPALQPTRS